MSDLNREFDRVLHQVTIIRAELGSIRDRIVTEIYREAQEISEAVVGKSKPQQDLDYRIDRIVTSKLFGYPLMLALLALVLWLTIAGANYPSQTLAKLLFGFQSQLTKISQELGTPDWLHGILVLGVYRCLAWVVAVMLPPMAIFFPIFTFLEDLGYLPRVAFNLDSYFKKAGAHGKQVLTMCMGFGCNAAGVTACRIIDSPRERLIAILTNNFVPCNGRFPTLIAMAAVMMGLLGAGHNYGLTAVVVTGIVVLGIGVTLVVSWACSKTLLKGLPSTFTLELPPYRLPKVGVLLVRSVFDRTMFVLARAVMVAAPAGGFIWLLANIQVGGISIITHLAGWLDGFGVFIGLDGMILLAFILGLPANEIVIPIMMMGYLSQGSMAEFDSLNELQQLLVKNGWTWLTALNMMLFSLLHFPCATTLLTIRRETQKSKWPFLAALIPTGIGIAVCALVAQVVRLF